MDDSTVTAHQGVRSLLGLKTAYILLYTRVEDEEVDGEGEVDPASFIGPQRPVELKRKREEDSQASLTDPSQTPPAVVANKENPFVLKKARTEEDVGQALRPANLQGPAPIKTFTGVPQKAALSTAHATGQNATLFVKHRTPLATKSRDFHGVTAEPSKSWR
jgi:hypothetical protein